MAIRNDFTAGEVLAAADLNDTFASKPPFAYGTATPSTTVDGFVWYDENSTPPAPKFWDGAAFQSFGGGKVLQVVRATDATARSTTSTSYVDTSLSITITPQIATSQILLIGNTRVYTRHPSYSGAGVTLQITDNSNVAISGAENTYMGHVTAGGAQYLNDGLTTIAYDSPGSTAAKTYKLRMKADSGCTLELPNNLNTNQIYAIEVSA